MERNRGAEADCFETPRAHVEIPNDDDHKSNAADRQSELALHARQSEWPRLSDNEDSTRMFRIIASGNIDALQTWIKLAPNVVQMRSRDGRGPLWWSYENDNLDMVRLLIAYGANEAATDDFGKKPEEMSPY